ncbi:MAG: GTPase [Gammaproteobacteria bacterium]|nr:MAG: GTPase [Gammaproteobacteria bacterium]RKZ36492.1 MAG: GTPase [Gammaproteobacteria bacterium]RKZ72313.1 MAG: GTPase [Gammaproteobacteria bacterium]
MDNTSPSVINDTTQIDIQGLIEQEDILSIRRQQQAEPIIIKSVWAARAVGLLPLPWVDFFGLLTIQTNMVSELSKIYQVDFSVKKIRTLILLILGSANPSWIVTALLSNLSKLMPGVGLVGTIITQPVITGAATYAIGKIFINHFELGGTLLDFDAKSTRQYFMQEFAKGKEKMIN